MAQRARTARAAKDYIAELRRRGKESRVYSKHQLLGLAIAEALADQRHKSLYIKLAKERGGERLLAIAKDVAERRDVHNRGAYFMAMIAAEAPPLPKKVPMPKPKQRARAASGGADTSRKNPQKNAKRDTDGRQ